MKDHKREGGYFVTEQIYYDLSYESGWKIKVCGLPTYLLFRSAVSPAVHMEEKKKTWLKPQ